MHAFLRKSSDEDTNSTKTDVNRYRNINTGGCSWWPMLAGNGVNLFFIYKFNTILMQHNKKINLIK